MARAPSTNDVAAASDEQVMSAGGLHNHLQTVSQTTATTTTHALPITMKYRTTLSLACAVFAATATTASPFKHHAQIPLISSSSKTSMTTETFAHANSAVVISDIITLDRKINIFAGLTRDVESISSRLDDTHANTTVLAPLNSAITSLPRKPWEDPKEYESLGESAYEGSDGEDRAQRNLRRFVEAHAVPVSPWEEGQKVKTVGGSEVWWERNAEGRKVVMPGKIVVDSLAAKAGNGEVWVLKEALNYAS